MVNEASKSRRWMLAVLIVSLALNLFLGGLMAGRWFSGAPHRQPAIAQAERGSAGEPGRFFDRMASALPREHRGNFEAAVGKHRERVVRAAGEAREAREQVREVLRQEPFDRAALDRAFDTVRTRNMALQMEIQAAIADGAAGLPAEARERLADWRVHGRGR